MAPLCVEVRLVREPRRSGTVVGQRMHVRGGRVVAWCDGSGRLTRGVLVICWGLGWPSFGVSARTPEVPHGHHDPIRCSRPGRARVHEHGTAGISWVPRRLQRAHPPGLRTGLAAVRGLVPAASAPPVPGPPRGHRVLRPRSGSPRPGPGHDHPPAVHRRRVLPLCGRGRTPRWCPGVLVSWWLCLATACATAASRISSSLPAMVGAQPISLGTLRQSIIFRARTASRPSGWPSAGRLTAPSTRWCQLTERCAAAPWVVPRAAPNLDSCWPSCALPPMSSTPGGRAGLSWCCLSAWRAARCSRRRRAGARRTDTAYPRFLQAYKGSDVLVGPAGSGGGYDNALAGLPDVAAIAPIVGLQALPVGPGGKLVDATVTAPLDGRFGHTLEVPKMLAGRQPLPNHPGEVMVDQIAARDLHLRVGSRLEMGAGAGTDFRHIRRLSERVAGIMVNRGSVVPVTDLDKTPVIIASEALFRELGPGYEGSAAAYVKLRPGGTVSDFSARAQALTRKFPATGGQIFLSDEAAQAAAVERSIPPPAVGLAVV